MNTNGKAPLASKIEITFHAAGEAETIVLDFEPVADPSSADLSLAEVKMSSAREEWSRLQAELEAIGREIGDAFQASDVGRLGKAKKRKDDLPFSVAAAEIVFRQARLEVIRLRRRAAQAELERCRPTIGSADRALHRLDRAIGAYKHQVGRVAEIARGAEQDTVAEVRRLDNLRQKLGV